MRPRCAAPALLALLLFAAPLGAQNPEPSTETNGSQTQGAVAAETFRAGTQAFARGDYNAAALSFDMASKLAPHAAAIYNAARAWQEAGDLPRAADRYYSALQTEQLSDEQRTEGQAQYDKLQAKLGKISIIGPDGASATVEHVSERAGLPLTVHLRPGEHSVEVTFSDGAQATKVVDVTAGMDESILVAPPDQTREEVPPPTPRPPKPDRVVSSSPLRPIGFVLAGLGIAAGGAAIGLGLGALSARDDYDASGNTDLEARDQASTLRTFTNVAWIGAGVLTAAGVVFIVIGGDDDAQAQTTSLRLQVGPSDASFEIAF